MNSVKKHRRRNRWNAGRICRILLVLGLCFCTGMLQAAGEETENEMIRALAGRNQSFSPEDTVLTLAGNKPEGKEAAWTIMIYMIGSNLESRLGNGTKDMMEIEQAGIDYSRSNVLVYAGGSRRWVGNVRADCNGIYDMSRPGEERLVARTEKNASMGASQTLESFIRFSVENYPAAHYGLILWDHGGGPVWGYGNDELFRDDSLLMREMKQAMADSPFGDGSGKKLDFVGFDACLMGSLECMRVWQPYARYYIGSEELEPGDGWDYHFLEVLNDSDDPQEVTSHVIDSFQKYYESIETDSYRPDITLSCIDLSKLDRLMNAFTSLMGRMVSYQEEGGYMALRRVREGTRSFGSLGGEDEDAFAYELTDLGHLARGVQERFPEESAAVQQALHEVVSAACSNVEHAGGISFYYPAKDKTQFRMVESVYGDAGMPSVYMNYLNGIASRWQQQGDLEWKLEQAAGEGEYFRLPLTKEQQENTVSASCTILVPYSYDRYYPVVENIPLQIDADGTVLIPRQFPVFCIGTENGSLQLFRTVHMYDEDKRSVYRSAKLGLMNDIYYAVRIENSSSLNVQFQLSHDADTGEVSILDITQTGLVTGESAGKNSVELAGWEALYSAFSPLNPLRGKGGTLLPCTQWKKGDSLSMTNYPIEDDFKIISCGTQDMEQEFLAQVILTDGSGMEHGSELIRLEHKTFLNVSKETDQGTLEYTVYEDHAAVTGYEGSDEQLTVLPEVEGVPVTEIADFVFFKKILDARNDYVHLRHIMLPDTIRRIGRSAFQNCRDLEEITLPGGLTEIGAEAFSDCVSLKEVQIPEGTARIGKCAFAYADSLEEIVLPASLESVGSGVLMRTPALKRIALDPENSALRLQDGMLVENEGNILLAVPAGIEYETLAIPAGVEEIGYGAAQSALFQAVTFPEGLKEIGNFAFYGCPGVSYLAELALPDSLESIGYCAFGTGFWGLRAPASEEEWDVVTQIRIGKNVSHISEDAFCAVASRQFTVDPDNRYYADLEGALTNAAKDSLICAKTRIRGMQIIIPEGIVSFDWQQIGMFAKTLDLFGFEDVDTHFHLFLPSTLLHFPTNAGSGDSWCVHCLPGSAAQAFALEHGMQVNHLWQPEYETVQVTEDGWNLSFRIYGDEAVLTECSGEGSVLRIPEYVEGAAVTGIGDGTAAVIPDTESCENLEQVVFPDTLQLVNSYAFLSVKAAFSSLPEGVKVIGDQAFYWSGFTTESLPAGVTFLGNCCMDLQGTFAVTPELAYIAPGAFSSWYFEGFTQEGENPYYHVRDGYLFSADGTRLLYAPPALAEELKVPSGTVLIGPHAFEGNGKLKLAELPAELEQIEEYAFSGCSALETIRFSEGLRRIGAHAFDGCSALNHLDFPGSLEEIGESAFSDCEAMDTVHFAEGLRMIDRRAFSETSLLVPAVLPDSRAVIAYGAFLNRWTQVPDGIIPLLHFGSGLESLDASAVASQPVMAFEVDPENAQYASTDGFLTDAGGTTLLLVPPGLEGTVEIPEGITRISNGAFSEYGKCTQARIPAGVTAIETGAISKSKTKVQQEDGTEKTEYLYTITILCAEGSAAHRYAEENGIPFILE